MGVPQPTRHESPLVIMILSTGDPETSDIEPDRVFPDGNPRERVPPDGGRMEPVPPDMGLEK